MSQEDRLLGAASLRDDGWGGWICRKCRRSDGRRSIGLLGGRMTRTSSWHEWT
jgi:hypothetical protein